MIRVFILLFLLLYLGTASGAQQIPKSFSHLSQFDVGEVQGWKGIRFIYYKSSISKILNQVVTEFEDDAGGGVRAIETKLDSTKDETYVIDYCNGPSDDPHFIVHQKVDNYLVKIGEFTGTELIVPGDGTMYISGEADDYFNKRRKYLLKNGLLKEVIQPYYYVGVKGANSQPLDLYADTNYKDTVVHLPVNSEIEVLLARVRDSNFNYDFLIKTSYGLLGWAYLNGQCGSEIIKDICFHGD